MTERDLLKSPVSGQVMQEVVIEGVRVHFDGSTGGYWLERGELETLAGHHRAHVTYAQMEVGATTQQQGGRHCPVDSSLLVEYEFGDHSGIRLDCCPRCEGIWLDGGELKKVLNYLDANAHLWEGVEHPPHEDQHITLTQRVLLLLYRLTGQPPLY